MSFVCWAPLPYVAFELVRKPDSLLEEKGRAVKEPEDDRGRPADRYRSHPSKHTD